MGPQRSQPRSPCYGPATPRRLILYKIWNFLLDLIFQNLQDAAPQQTSSWNAKTKPNKTKPNKTTPKQTHQNKQPTKQAYMRGKTFITSCCLFAIMACGTAFAQHDKLTSGPYKGPMAPMVVPDNPDAAPFYTNFELNSCTGCTYSGDNGFLVLGPSNCGIAGATQWLAYPFVSKKTGLIKKVVLAITDWSICVPTTHQFTVAVYTDACAGPANQIGTSTTANAPASPCLLASANFNGHGVSLTAGTRYWVVVTTNGTPQQDPTTAVWWETNPTAGYFNVNDGSGWLFGPSGGPGAFQVQ